MKISSTPIPPSLSANAVAAVALALLVLLTPFSSLESPSVRVGGLLALAALIEGLHGLRRSAAAGRRQATVSAAVSMAIALLLINASFVAAGALRMVLASWFGLDAIRHTLTAIRTADHGPRGAAALAAAGNAAVALVLLPGRDIVTVWIVAIAGAARILAIAWEIMTAPVFDAAAADETVVEELGFSHESLVVDTAAAVEREEAARTHVDRAWTIAFVATLFAIHIGRMETDWTLLGLISPAVAVVGDVLIALVITLVVVNPLYLLWRAPTRWLERRAWRRQLRRAPGTKAGLAGRLTSGWLRWRLRYAIRLRAARYSIPAALNQGLQTGLPFAAIIAATTPVWGMSWFFDTENWAAGIWNTWAESRTDTWRQAMVHAVVARDGPQNGLNFVIAPHDVGGDFSFVVIGDPGEGDASQHVLRDQLLAVANAPRSRFVLVSSDVVYPAGAMKDYEEKFFLPFKGISKPIYAIPGNHDWFDALEGFAATFFAAEAARVSLRARVDQDLQVSSTTDARIEELIGTAERLRLEYGIRTGLQRAPFFELQTPRFALLAIDTGVRRTIDSTQREWLDAALGRASGKLTMAVLGHPFYAGGHDTTVGNDEFTGLKRLLHDRGATIVMAGDTHDLEYYEVRDGGRTVHHLVNGGGGAYLSFGSALAWPSTPPADTWAYYPSRPAVTAKIEARLSWWKRPAWWWTTRVGAWPFTAEWLSAAFDDNSAPFFQSFVEVRVEPSASRVRILPYGVHGRLRWRDLASSRTGDNDGYVEWIIPMIPAR